MAGRNVGCTTVYPSSLRQSGSGELAGAKDMSAIAHWVRLRADQLSQELPMVCKQGSYAATSGNVLRSLDAQQCLG